MSKVSYIATVITCGKYLEFKVLASNAKESEFVGRFLEVENGRVAVEKKYGEVMWVLPYRFAKELSA